MKTRLLLLITCLALGTQAFAQLSAVDYKSKEFAAFKASTTYAVLTGNKKYDAELKAALADSWKVTPIAYINANELDAKITDATASFLVSIVIETRNAAQNYHYLALINGGKKKISRYEYDDMLAYCPINHFQNEPNGTDCYYRLRNMVESMVRTMAIVQDKDIKGSSASIVKDLKKQFNLNAKKIPERTLLICDETIGVKVTQKDLTAIFPYKFEVCNKKKLEQVIKDKSKDYYYLQPGITLNKSIFVIDPSNGEVVYFDYKIMGLNVNKDDFEDMVDVIKGK